ncbi:MAG: rhodanese-like domain-containing protein [bacterium]
MFFDLLKRFRYFYALIIIAGLFITACSEDETPVNNNTIDESKVLLEYLEANGDYINTVAPAIIKATDVNTLLLTAPTSIYIIDIRSAADFANGHIDGAVNVALADLLTHVKSINASQYEKIVIACYSGQTASYGTALLQMMGYTNVTALKWGMSSWNPEFKAKWVDAIGNSRATQFETTANTKPAAGNLPVINTGKKTGAEILETRVNQLLAEGYTVASVKNADVYSDLAKYYIINYWPETQYLNPGHIPGAYQYTPKADLKRTTMLKTLPTDKEVVVYCYTGMTSSNVAAFLRLLGYNAKSLLYGANAMIYDVMVSNTLTVWTDAECHDYDFVK